MTKPSPLTEARITEALDALPGWQLAEDRLVRGYTLPGHLAAVAMLVHVATVQEELNHHADLCLVFDRLDVSVTTHSVGGRVTDLDTRLAHRIEELAAGHGAR